ncbi:TIGR03757 family integrating conjugative element protein [Gluconacetobacter sp. Hr-1-5]|uniref:TIGR03757 family integrating conjugative element protein n=1 Tax=Gluconacetobacter sp. Hr-1-5 TaxID=3395370 RepID=UPI003B51A150
MMLAVLASVAVWSPSGRAEVLVVTDSHHPVEPTANATVVELDAPTWIEDELAERLPGDPEQAATLVRQRLHDGGPALQRRFEQAYQGVGMAFGLGVARIPAVVVDHRYVVYGDPDVARAVTRIERFRGSRP